MASDGKLRTFLTIPQAKDEPKGLAMAIKQYMIDAFAKSVFAGNQAAICLTANGHPGVSCRGGHRGDGWPRRSVCKG